MVIDVDVLVAFEVYDGVEVLRIETSTGWSVCSSSESKDEVVGVVSLKMGILGDVGTIIESTVLVTEVLGMYEGPNISYRGSPSISAGGVTYI